MTWRFATTLPSGRRAVYEIAKAEHAESAETLRRYGKHLATHLSDGWWAFDGLGWVHASAEQAVLFERVPEVRG